MYNLFYTEYGEGGILVANSETKKKKSGCGSCLIVLLVFVLLIVGAVGFLAYTIVMAPLKLDDPQAMAASAPMSVGERFRFSSADATAQVKLDKGDIWSFILEHAGDDFLDAINEEISSYSLSVSRCGIQLDEDELQLNLEVFYQEKIRLVVKAPCDLEIKDGHIVAKPTGVKLGIISLPVDSLLSGVEVEEDMVLPVIDNVNLEGFTKDAILLTGKVDQNIQDMVAMDETFERVTLFSESLQNLVRLMDNREEWKNILHSFEEDPASAEVFYRGIFSLSDELKRKEYLEDMDGLTLRIFPGLDLAGVKESRNDLIMELGEDVSLLKEFFTDVFDDYNDKKFTLSDGEFLLDGQPFHAGQYSEGKYGDLFEKLDPDQVFLVLVDAKDGYVKNTDPLKKMTDKKEQFTQKVDFNKPYILGCVIFADNGDAFLVYDADIHLEFMNAYVRRTILKPLTQEEVEALQVEGQFGVWTAQS